MFKNRLYGDPHNYNLDEVVREMAYFRGQSFYTLEMCQKSESPCFKSNLSAYAYLVRSTCSEMLKRCKWNDEEFDCCTFFTEIDTELGVCYGINSKQTR